MPSPSVLNQEEVFNVFRNLEVELTRIIKRQLRGTVQKERTPRLVEAIIGLVRSRWENARSLYHWWGPMKGKEQLRWDGFTIGLNSLYETLDGLGVDARRVLRSIARAFGWLGQSPLFIIDDTSRQKYGKHMEGVSSVHVANVNGCVMGHTVVTLMTSVPGGAAMYLDHEIKMNRKRPRVARRRGRLREVVRQARDRTKLEMALQMIDRTRPSSWDEPWVLFDCWYFNAKMTRELNNRDLTFISKSKKNYPFIVDGVEMTAGEFQESCTSWKRVRQTDHFFYQKKATLKDGTPVKLVATWFFRGRSLKKSTAVLVTNQLDIPGPEIVSTYLLRWETERGYQDWKHSLAGMEYQSTSFERIENYVWIGFIGYALARRARELIKPDVGLPTLLAAWKSAVETMIPTRLDRFREPESMMRRAA